MGDLELPAESLLPKNNITQIKHYTARVAPRNCDPGAPGRQKVYLKALDSVHGVKTFYGKFQTNHARMALVHPPKNGSKFALVIKTEEKRSDANLASHPVSDSADGKFDVAAILANDSDFVEPIRMAIEKYGKKVVLLTPTKRPNREMKNTVSSVLHINDGHLKRAQFPDEVTHPDGTLLTRPENWRLQARSP